MIPWPVQSLLSLVAFLLPRIAEFHPTVRVNGHRTASAPDRSTAPPPQTPKTQTHTGTRRKEKPKKSNAKKRVERERERERERDASIGDGCGSEGAEEGRRGGASRRWSKEEAGLPLREGRPSVPRRPYRTLPQAGPLLPAHRHRRARLPRRRPRVPRRGGPRAGGERGARQQEEPDHPAARAAGDPQRRGAREAAGRRHHRARRGAAQHQPRAAPQEDRIRRCQGGQGGQGEEVAQEGRHQVAQEGGRSLGPPGPRHGQCGAPSLAFALSPSGLN